MLKKAIIFIFSFCLLIAASLSAFTTSAAVINQGIITVGTVTGNTGDTVIVPITIEDNPGICGITVSITYNSSALEFVEDMMGNVIYEYMTKAHPTKNIIRLVTSEQGNKYNNGTMLSLKFKIADKAPAELHKIDITYRSGDFCNWKLDRIMPKIIAGGVNVNLSKSNCPHKSYTEWSTATIPTCTENGAEMKTCNACGHVELRDTEPIGHEYSKDYTVDKEATKNESGLMSRHCIRCKDFTDQISYTLKDSDDGNIKNEFDTIVPPNDYINNLHKDQYPENEPESSATQNNNSASSTNSNEPTINEKPVSNPNEPTISEPQEQPLIEPDKNIKLTVIEKIKEVFPEFDSIFNIFKIALTLFSIIILL